MGTEDHEDTTEAMIIELKEVIADHEESLLPAILLLVILKKKFEPTMETQMRRTRKVQEYPSYDGRKTPTRWVENFRRALKMCGYIDNNDNGSNQELVMYIVLSKEWIKKNPEKEEKLKSRLNNVQERITYSCANCPHLNNHSTDRCRRRRCDNHTQSRSHTTKECWPSKGPAENPQSAQKKTRMQCTVCGSSNHNHTTDEACPLKKLLLKKNIDYSSLNFKEKDKGKTCYRCDQKSHLTFNCPISGKTINDMIIENINTSVATSYYEDWSISRDVDSRGCRIRNDRE
eukprot:Awhi_evm1s14595